MAIRSAGTKRIAEIDVASIGALLERTKQRLAAQDHALVKQLCESFIELTKLARQRGTTIAQLRRLVGTASSEKSERVLGDRGGAAGGKHSSDDAEGIRAAAPDPLAENENQTKGHGRIKALDYPDAKHIAVRHQTLAPKDPCPACNRGTLFELKEPARFLRIIGQPPLCAVCWDCQRLRCSGCGKVYTARPPPEAQGPKHSETAASMIALLRYGTGLPFHRLEHLQRHLQTPLPASTQWDVVLQRAPDVLPVYEELCRLGAQGSVVHNDDTFVRILAFMGKRRAELLAQAKLEDPERTGLFTTAIVAINEHRPIALFFTGRKHAGENLASLLDQRGGNLAPPILMSDALERNVPKGHKVDWANCLAHGRRGVVDEIDNFPAECEHILSELAKVFAVDARCKRQHLSDEERLRVHQENSGPVMNDLEQWLTALVADKRFEPSSGMGQAINYLLKRWDRLTRFLRVRGAPLENNICERALKMAIRQRNNSLFYKTLRGAKLGDIYMTLIHTAVLHRQNPFDYLTAVQQNAKAVASSPGDWLPWNYRATLGLCAPDALPSEPSLH